MCSTSAIYYFNYKLSSTFIAFIFRGAYPSVLSTPRVTQCFLLRSKFCLCIRCRSFEGAILSTDKTVVVQWTEKDLENCRLSPWTTFFSLKITAPSYSFFKNVYCLLLHTNDVYTSTYMYLRENKKTDSHKNLLYFKYMPQKTENHELELLILFAHLPARCGHDDDSHFGI